jgi:hypothetical protein
MVQAHSKPRLDHGGLGSLGDVAVAQAPEPFR